MFGLPIFFSRFLSPLPLDVRIREHHEIGTEIASAALEDGSNVNDHAFIKPARFQIEFASSNATAAWQGIKRVVHTRYPFMIVSGLDVYKNMMIDLATADLDKDSDRILRGTVDMVEIRIASTAYGFAFDGGSSASGAAGGANSTRSAPLSSSRAGSPATSDAAAGTVNRGDSPTSNPHPDAPAQNQSILASIF